jgi:uncharacterized protein (UPF0332 family)
MSDLVSLEIERGDEALQSAETLKTAGLYRDAMSRTYYAVLHYARALLPTRECHTKSHHGVVQMFSQLFVRPGLILVETGRILSRQQKFREESDYTVEIRFTQEAIEAEIADARIFREVCVSQIQKQN